MSDTINHFKEACESPLSSRGNRTRKLIDNPPAKGISLDAKNIYQNLSIPALVCIPAPFLLLNPLFLIILFLIVQPLLILTCQLLIVFSG